MNGVHDMGGMHGMGSIVHEEDEPVFHHEWERRAFAIALASGFLGKWNIDTARFARERIPPAEYLRSTYYEKWVYGLETLLLETGLVSPEELGDGRARGPAQGVRVLRRPDVERALGNRRAARVYEDRPAKFKAGEAVAARNVQPVGHIRMPRYVRGRRGVIDRDHGVFIFPDTHAAGLGTKPQHVYAVRFTAQELWGPEASARDAVYVDLWDDYLEPA